MNSVHAARMLRVIAAIAFAIPAVATAQDSRPARPPLALTADNIGSVIDPMMANWTGKRKGPGAVVVVVNRDGEVFANGYGYSDIAAKKPFTADTLVRPGSISKLFTGIAVMQLVDAGKLDLDRDVNGYIDFAIPTPEGGVPVTLRRLLTHRAGFEEHFKGLFSRNPEPEPLGHWLARSLPRRLYPKGDVEAYSNYGAALAGYVVERVSGEPFAVYIQKYILDPLGMNHSTFAQPLPDDLAPLLAKTYRPWPLSQQDFFQTIVAPAGALSSTGADMGRFMRMLINGGELDGVRILAKARLEEMMTPANATGAGYIGLVFIGTKVLGHPAIGHNGDTTTFFSDLQIFPERGIGVFVLRSGTGEITAANQIPRPAIAIARRFLPRVMDAAPDADLPSNPAIAGVYHPSRRAETSFVRLNDLARQRLVTVDADGHAGSYSAIWPFGARAALRQVEPKLYRAVNDELIAFVDGSGAGSYWATPALQVQRAPWYLDGRWIAPAFLASLLVALLTVLAWPVAAVWRYWRKQRWNEDRGEVHKHRVVRLILLVDMAVIVATAALVAAGIDDLTRLNDALDPFLIALYGFAWLGVVGAGLALWVVTSFWRNGTGSGWSRIHHSLMAASCLMLAWFFVTFGIAGTTLNY